MIINCEFENAIAYVTYLIGVSIQSFIVYSLYKLEESTCECAKIKEKNYIKEWFMFIISLNTISIFLFLISNEDCYKKFELFSEYSSFIPIKYVFILILLVVNIYMLVKLYIYINILKGGCSCGYGLNEKIIYWYLMIVFVVFILLIILIGLILIISLMSFITIYFYSVKKNK